MIPLRDENPRTQFPLVNSLLIAANVLIFVNQFIFSASPDPIMTRYSAVPLQIMRMENLHTLVTSMFLHGGYMHIIGNMLYLYVFGDNVENLMGSLRYLLFYLLCGIGATMTHVLSSPGSQVPLVGASGAISGVLAAYAVSFPRAKVLVAIPIFFYISTARVPAVVLIGFWFLLQVFSGVVSGSQASGTAWFAHIGGFVIGLVLLRFFRPARKRRVLTLDDDPDDF